MATGTKMWLLAIRLYLFIIIIIIITYLISEQTFVGYFTTLVVRRGNIWLTDGPGLRPPRSNAEGGSV